jgi:anti-sigma regulatory factor (Ser/Thr protein kinase)
MTAVIEEPSVHAAAAAHEWFFLEAPARAEQAGRMRHALADFLRRHQWSEDDVDLLSLAVGEACSNAVNYSPANAFFSLCAELIDRTKLRVEVRNPSNGFTPDLKRIQEWPDDDATHGRGFPLMYRLVDEVDVRREDDSCVVRLIKRLPA